MHVFHALTLARVSGGCARSMFAWAVEDLDLHMEIHAVILQ